ncbi:Tim44/TimA family putative adaptor protein [Tropicimonas sp. IMCC6043]|uniref:Tim44/TimA family putative adaptor protein n=1 Tax=Tropicimonas sp. IMCC6043 TaxID=2510645 RepID=UPI00101BC3AC|nr:Tim44/TimA family putative adaptor protein [Tropicimonas sp. IMCC6043]RYH10879.1 Tim44 domain-containing protein [Tropicimonas sp. IMCC6043]
MSAAVIQLLVLAGIAIFLILRLRSVLGTREGFEKPPLPLNESKADRSGGRPDFEVIEGGVDHDITDHVAEGSPAAEALGQMKRVEPAFSVGEFLQGARGAYEMILMAFEHGDIDQVAPFLSPDVHDAFADVIRQREAEGLSVDANFVGVRELSLVGAEFDKASDTGEITVRFVGELTSVVRNAAGEVIEGSASEIKRQRDIWTFARKMGGDDPNWQLVATGE